MDLLHKKNINSSDIKISVRLYGFNSQKKKKNSSDINRMNKLSTKMDWKFAKEHIV